MLRPFSVVVAAGVVAGVALLARRVFASPAASSAPAAPPPRVLPDQELDRLFGALPWTAVEGNDSAIHIDPAWKTRHLATIEIPQLRHVPGGNGGRVTVHRGIAERLQAAFADIERAGLLDRVLSWDGSFAERRVRGRPTVSRHARGVAFDINAQHNPLGAEPAPAGETGSVRELVPIFERHGFAWGGNFRGRKDGMHFEAGR